LILLILAFGSVALHGQVRSGRVEGERFDRVDGGRLAVLQMDDSQLALNRLLVLSQFFFL
jgi:hypothetical protein